jgi:glycosyltransferase involved in cell wall biosynthesis
MSAPEATVVVPTRDRPRMLASTVRSLLAQRDVGLDIVVVDDGSSPEHAAGVAALAGDRVRVLRNATSGGVGVARNRGVEAARAPWVAFCDDDDLWTPTKLSGQLHAARSTDRGWAYTGAVKFETGPTIWQLMPPPSPEAVHAGLPTKNLIPAGASNVLVHRESFLAVGGFDGHLAHLADWDLWLKLRDVGLPAAAPGLGVAYRMHVGAMSLNPDGILEDLATIDTRWRHVRGGRSLDPGPTHLWIARSWLRAGRRLPAAASYLRAARSDPRRGLRGVARTAYPRRPRPAGSRRHAGGSGDAATVPAELWALLEADTAVAVSTAVDP